MGIQDTPWKPRGSVSHHLDSRASCWRERTFIAPPGWRCCHAAFPEEDRVAWVAYPKAGQLDTDLNRDILARRLEQEGIQAVRQVAIDTVWSALRFRPGT